MNITNLISPRELQVLHLVAYEYTSKEIANRLFLSHHTVDTHVKNLKDKLDVRKSAGLVRRGFELGLIQSSKSS